MNFVLLIALAFNSSNAWWINQLGRKKFVRIVNNLNNGERLNFRCQSKNVDLGVHSLAVNEQFQFHFKVNFWGRTLFFCRLWYLDKHVEIVAFKSNLDFQENCGGDHCIWIGKEDGVYMFRNSKNENILTYLWEKN
ncbi:putative plant self-incompatibility S1 [Rosa chinensis]|uniref:S-protein homolog n=1 Tax=Rosa chinensis TaxID=74649 RepID=A0A2P6R570_ROSCH|nr:putative plant self-incompatibility S1 [Rosa chinensis]